MPAVLGSLTRAGTQIIMRWVVMYGIKLANMGQKLKASYKPGDMLSKVFLPACCGSAAGKQCCFLDIGRTLACN